MAGYLTKMLNPETVAVLGASGDEDSQGRFITQNLLSVNTHRTFPVNPHTDSIAGLPCFNSITDIPEHLDLVIIATPALLVPDLVEERGKKGVEGIIIVSRGFRETGEEGGSLEERIVRIRQRYGMRILRPRCVSVIRPNIGLNASLVPLQPERGKIAFFSHSGSLGSAMLDGAAGRHIGFYMFASLGSMMDLDIGHLVDFVGDDESTKKYFGLYGTSGGCQKVYEAARGFARNKPIIVMKPGRFVGNVRPGSSAFLLAGDDAVYDAAFQRAGMVRVEEIGDLFGAAAVLDAKTLPKGPDLAVITNVHGAGPIATDFLLKRGGMLARLSDASLNLLGPALTCSPDEANLITIRNDSEADLYEKVTKALYHGKYPGRGRIIWPSLTVRLCNIDYDRHMAFVAEIKEKERPCVIGTARLISEPGTGSAEFAVLVSDDYQGRGLGYKLIDVLVGIGQDWGLDEIYGDVLKDNLKMVNLTKKLGFGRKWLTGGVTKVVLKH